MDIASHSTHILERLPDAIAVVGPDTTLRWANAAAERVFGLALEEMVGTPGFELVHPDDRHYVALSMESVQAKDYGTLVEVRMRSACGYRLVEAVGATLDSGDIVLCLRDITDRRRFEVAHDDEARLRALVHNARSVTILVEPTGEISSVSGALSRITDFDNDRVAGRPLAVLVASEDDEAALTRALANARPGEPTTVLISLRGVDGERVPVEMTIVDLCDDPIVSGFVISGHEVTERIQVERDLRSALGLLEATLDSTADGILVVDREGRITSFNRQFVRLWRIPDSVLEAKDDSAAIAFVLDQLADPGAFVAKVEELYADPEAESYDSLEFKDGRVFERFSTPQRVDNEVVGRVWSFRDRTEHKQLEAALIYRAYHDQLTGLANKEQFCDRLQHTVVRSSRTGHDFAVLFLDIDNFKTVNDSLGHQAGDELLMAAAEILTSCLRASDTAARLGGDEFAVLVEDLTDPTDAARLAERICRSFRRSFRVATHEVFATASVGIAFGDGDSTSEQILRNADLAMYMAKSRGKNRFELFESKQHDAAVVRVEVEAELHQAIEREELLLFHQPIVEVATGTVAACEALVRWEHPIRGLLLPGTFIPLAEESGLMDVLGAQVLRRACHETILISRETDMTLQVSINVSPAQLTSGRFTHHVVEVLEATGFAPDRLMLEITETAMVTDADVTARCLAELKDLGVVLALDDFGTGYSSLTFLRQFPIDVVKIDKSFVADLEELDPRQSLAPAVITLAHSLGMTTIAEGVETPRQLGILTDLGCDYVQGFLLHRPRTAESLIPALQAETAPRRLAS